MFSPRSISYTGHVQIDVHSAFRLPIIGLGNSHLLIRAMGGGGLVYVLNLPADPR